MPALNEARAALVRVSAAVAARDDSVLDRALRSAMVADQLQVEEILLQAHLFVGFPLALEALGRWRALCGRSAPDAAAEGPDLWAVRGPAVCQAVYAENYAKLRANVQAIHPDVDRWMVEGGYGKVIGRPGLDLPTRELCIAALLVVWDAPRQLHSHMRGALNTGASPEELREAVEIASGYASAPAAEHATDLLNRLIR